MAQIKREIRDSYRIGTISRKQAAKAVQKVVEKRAEKSAAGSRTVRVKAPALKSRSAS